MGSLNKQIENLLWPEKDKFSDDLVGISSVSIYRNYRIDQNHVPISCFVSYIMNEQSAIGKPFANRLKGDKKQMSLLNYNRSILTNQVDTFSVVLTGVDQLILQFGLFVPQATNFVELLTTVGWQVTGIVTTLQPTIGLTVFQDGVIVASADQESVSDGEDEDLEMTTTFQAVLTNVPAGHHVYSVFARNIQPDQGTITITGPANISGKVIS